MLVTLMPANIDRWVVMRDNEDERNALGGKLLRDGNFAVRVSEQEQLRIIGQIDSKNHFLHACWIIIVSQGNPLEGQIYDLEISIAKSNMGESITPLYRGFAECVSGKSTS